MAGAVNQSSVCFGHFLRVMSLRGFNGSIRGSVVGLSFISSHPPKDKYIQYIYIDRGEGVHAYACSRSI